MPERALSSQSVFAARPTVHVNGDVSPRLASLLVGMDLCEHEDGLGTLELRLTNIASAEAGGEAGFAFEDERSVKWGDRLTVYGGDEVTPQELFRGIVTAFEGCFGDDCSPTLVVLAEDELQKARMRRRTKTWERCTIARVAEAIAVALSLTPRIDGFTSDVGTQVQANESDLAFLRRLLARYDGEVQVVGSELHVAPRRGIRRSQVTLRLHRQLRRARVLADLANQVTEVTVTGWDSTQGQRISGRCRTAPRGPGRGRTGAELLAPALQERSHQLGHLMFADADEARAVAESAFLERQRRFVTVEGTAEGNPALRVGTHVTLEGLGPRFSNTYYVTRCRHRYDLVHGYETDFTAESAFLGTP